MRRALLVLLTLCVASRLATTIFYIEDTDSLRFALSLQDYDVARLRPHFPGYPLFWAAAKPLFLLTGSYAVAFALVGGLATWVIAALLPRFAGERVDAQAGGWVAAMVVLNPLLWLMGNRYMPDLLGLACAVAALYWLTAGGTTPRRRQAGALLTGVLAGVRLSYLPLLLVPVLAALARRGERPRLAAAGAAGVLVWLIPLAWDTGPARLLAAARRQTAGHFGEFGGTVVTEPLWSERLAGLVRGLTADGLGAYWPLRHPVTLLVAAGLLLALLAGWPELRRRTGVRLRWTLAASWATYLVWIAAYQNVIYKSRHVLPLLPPLLLIAGLGLAALWKTRRPAARGAAGLALAAYAAVALVLAAQHRQPTAVAQLAAELRQAAGRERTVTVVSIPLVGFYLQAQRVPVRFVSLDDGVALAELRRRPPAGRVVAVGRFPELLPGRASRRRVLYHNPYVNRMWSEIEVYEYEPER